MDPELKAFAEELARDVEDGVSSGEGEPWSEHEFTRQILERLGDAGTVENPQPLPQGGSGRFGRSEYSISGFSVPDDDDPERIVIFTTLYRGEGPDRKLAAGELKTAATLAARFVLASFKGLHTRIEPSNTEASDLAHRLMTLKDRIHTVRIAILSDCSNDRVVKETVSDAVRFAVDVYDIESLHRILGKGRVRDDIELDFESVTGAALPCLSSPAAGAGYDAFLATVPGNVLADVYDRYGTRLLELNVRAFLGIRGRKSVNSGLRETIMKSPDHFLAYNNGIVATVDNVELLTRPDGSVALKRVSGLQIVNGGQTTASLHRARRVDKADLSNVSVPAKLIHVRSGDHEALQSMVTSISRSANSQNTVQPADFSSNDPFHQNVETLANNVWCPGGRARWFYDRARGSYEAAQDRGSKQQQRRFKSESPKDKRFSKTDLAKYLNAWEGYPHLVCFGGQKNFQAFMQRLKDQQFETAGLDEAWYKRFVAIAILFRSAQKTARRLKFPAYQANITAYVVAGLGFATGGRIDFDRIWNQQQLSPQLDGLIEQWSRLINDALRASSGQRMPTEWSKKEQCWIDVRAKLPPLPDVLPPEISVAVVPEDEDEGVSGDDLEVVRRAQSISAAQWRAVADWGKATRGNEWRLASVVGKLVECADDGWKQVPSARVVRRALRAFELHTDEHRSGSAGVGA